MLKLRDADRVRILSAVARKGPLYSVRRTVVITLSLLVLLAIPMTGLARVDLWGGAHRMLGRPATIVEGLQAVVVALGVLYGVTFLTNTFLGRFFCGWGCPVGYVSRLGEDVDRKQPVARPAARTTNAPAARTTNVPAARTRFLAWAFSHLAGAGFVATFVGAVMCWWVDPRVMIDGSPRARLVTGGIFLVLWLGGFAHAFLWRFGFCLHACPIGLYYRLVTSRPPVGIVFSEVPDPCIQCGACVNVCPVDLEPRDLGRVMAPRPGEDPSVDERYGDAECLRCGDCVEACRMVFLIRRPQTPPLRFGFHGKDGTDAGTSRLPSSPANGPARPKLDADGPPMLDPHPPGDVAAVRPPSPGAEAGPRRAPS